MDTLLAFGDVGCNLVVGVAASRFAGDPEQLAPLRRLAPEERASLRPLLEASASVWSQWLQTSPEGAAYAALGLYAFGLWTRYRTVQALAAMFEAHARPDETPRAGAAPAQPGEATAP